MSQIKEIGGQIKRENLNMNYLQKELALKPEGAELEALNVKIEASKTKLRDLRQQRDSLEALRFAD